MGDIFMVAGEGLVCVLPAAKLKMRPVFELVSRQSTGLSDLSFQVPLVLNDKNITHPKMGDIFMVAGEGLEPPTSGL